MHMKEFSARVVSFKLLAALEQYELDLRALAESWVDAEALRRLQQEFGSLRILGASLPKLSVSWVAVLLSRTRLLQAWSGRGEQPRTALQDHLAAVKRLRVNCLRTIGAQSVALA